MLAVRAILDHLFEVGPMLVAFSGGVDSAVLSDLATEALGGDALIATAVSPSLAAVELEVARRTASLRGWKYIEVSTHELDREAYAANGPDRCYHCRTELFEVLGMEADRRGIPTLALGAIADDAGDHRPGLDAAREASVIMPLLKLGVTKDQVRQIARDRGLDVWDKPASPCLASRIPYGTPVTLERLQRIEAAEAVLRSLGLTDCRVREHDGCARIEVPCEEFDTVMQSAAKLATEIRRVGFDWVSLDLAGLQSGSLNRRLPLITNV